MKMLRVKSLESILQHPDWKLDGDKLHYKNEYSYNIPYRFLDKVYEFIPHNPRGSCPKLKYRIPDYILNEDLVEEIWEE